ncbi:MAG: C40 family peptidase [Actinobacteria bacterium]|nr:C40 family peptidase [Actinomycetota bacterium]
MASPYNIQVQTQILFFGGFGSISLKRSRTMVFLASVLALVLAMTLCPLLYAQPLDEAKKDVETLQQKLEDSVERYNYACSKLEGTQSLIEENKVELAEAEEELAVNKDRLNDRVRAMYVTRHNEFLDVVVNAGNFDEFLVGMDLAKKVGQKDAELVKDVKDAKAKLDAAKESLAERKSEQQAAKEEIAASKAAVEGELSSAKGRLVGIEDEIRQAMARRAEEGSPAPRYRDDRAPYVAPVVRRSAPPGSPHGGVVEVAYAQLGKPYVWGTAGPNTFDCSGLVAYCYSVGAGIEITHSSYGQASCGTPVSVSELQPGDIVGFRGWGHVGLYIGDGQYIHAPQSGDVVKISSLSSRGNFCGAVRP